MEIKFWICLSILCLALLLMFCNKKIRCSQLIKDAFSVFKDNRNGKVYWYDLLTFFGCPVIISVSVIFGFNYWFNKEMASTLLNVFSIMFTLLFGVISILTSTIESNDEIRKKITKEAFATASFSMLISFLNLVILIVYIALQQFEMPTIIFMFLSGIVIVLSLIMMMLFFMIIKRSYITSISNK